MSPLSPTAQNFGHACTFHPPHRFVQSKFSADVIPLKHSNLIFFFFGGKGFGLVL